MKKYIASLLLAYCCWTGSVAQNVWSPDNGDGTFTNPILWGDWPDPDVIRVGDDFYMVSTSMHYVPGCPILHSKDLVNWEMEGYAVERYDEDPRFDMQGGTLYLNGAWASTLRYRDGLFYVGFCTPRGWGREKGNFSMCVSDSPRGPWKRTIFPEFMYDPGLLFDDDGRVYVVHGQGTLYVTELASDALSVKSAPKEIWRGGFKNAFELGGHFGMEGSHVYKINGKYYITCPAGGTEGWQICLRSDNIYGPYEHKLIANDDSSYPPNGLHQGGMVQLKNGDWWFIIMQDRGPIGRVANLLPVTWTDGWPMLGVDGKDVVTYPKPDVERKCRITAPATSDEFSDKRLGLQWQWNHNPDPERYSLTERRGYMRLKAAQAADLNNARNTLTQRVQGPLSQGSVEMESDGMKTGGVAGLGVFQKPYAFVGVEKTEEGYDLVMSNNGKVVAREKNIPGRKIWLRARTDDKLFRAVFYYSLDGKIFRPFGEELQMGLGLYWTANRFALFHFSTTSEGVDGQVDFNWFRMTDK